MSLAVVYALCCLAFAASNDFVFKLYARKERSRGLFVAVVGLVWFALSLLLPWAPESDTGATWLYGAVSGFFSVTANLILIEAMTRYSAGMCSTLYRLNMVLVVLAAALFLGESPSALQWAGIACATLAVLAFLPASGGVAGGQGRGVAIMAGAAALRAGMGLTYKIGFLHGADPNGVVLVNSLFWIAGGLVYAGWRERPAGPPSRKTWGYGALSGALVTGLVVFMAAMLARGDASVVLPVAQMSFLGTFLLGAVFLKEPVNRYTVAALACGAAAVTLLTIG